MEFKGTKGPWTIEKHSTLETNIVSGNTRIADVKHYNTGEDDWTKNDPVYEEGKANAKLISKSPEMLDEIKESLIDIKILRNQIANESKINNRFDGMSSIMDSWIDRKEKLIKEATEI
jgi:hypothetical protein